MRLSLPALTRFRMRALSLLMLLGACLMAQAQSNATPAIRYVKPTATGTGSGNSWANASGDLQAMINASSSGQQVWVARGTYKPGGNDNADRTISFAMKNGVSMYGGFAGSETTLSDRPAITLTTPSSTTLSGDVGEVGYPDDNSFHVILNRLGVTNMTVLDGFVITGGNANEAGPPQEPRNIGGGMCNVGQRSFANPSSGSPSSPQISNCWFVANSAVSGGAIYNGASELGVSSPTLTNCVFRANTASNGGAIYNVGGSGSAIQPKLTDCLLQANSATISGGAVYNNGSFGRTSNPELTNCSFQDNSAAAGGAIYNDGKSDGGNSSPTLTNCSFKSNRADSKGATSNDEYFDANNSGGAIVNYGDFNGKSSPLIRNCSFQSNSAVGSGGAIFNITGRVGGGNISSPKLTNCLFQSNTAPSGGAIYNFTRYEGEINLVLTNCTFRANTATNGGGVLYGYGYGNNYISTSTLINCVLFGNGEGRTFYNDFTTISATYSLFDASVTGYSGSTGNCTATVSPFASASDPALFACSPAVNAGLNSATGLVGVTTDLAGNARVFGGRVDMGAYEYQAAGGLTITAPSVSTATADIAFSQSFTAAGGTSPYSYSVASGSLPLGLSLTTTGVLSGTPTQAGSFTLTVLGRDATGCSGVSAPYVLTVPVPSSPVRYVRAGGAGDGTSWANASGDLQSQINATGVEQVWVAGGIYKPTTTTNRSISFAMKNGVTIYGGFVGSETSLSGRVMTYPSSTTLSGDIGAITNDDNSYHVIVNPPGLTSTAVLDGVVITAGNASTNDASENGYGGGMYNSGLASGQICSPTIRNCWFINNSVIRRGGAIYNGARAGGTSSPQLINCVFVNNSANGGGGAIWNGGNNGGTSSPQLINCAFVNNSSRGLGGTMLNDGSSGGNSSPQLTNCSFLSNSATTGGGMLSQGAAGGGNSRPQLTNCVFFNNGGSNTFYNDGATITASYSLFEVTVTGYTGSNNQTVSTSPFVSESDVQLRACSPAVDAGNDVANTTATDVLGNARKVRTIDMGAAEFGGSTTQPVQLSNQLQTTPTVCAGQRIGLAADLSGTGPFTIELFRDNTRIGGPDTFSGSRIGLNPIADQSGSYQIVVTSACNSVTTTFTSFTVNSLPTTYAVTGGGTYCAGNTAPNVGLAGSQTGVNYQLLRGTTPVGTPVAGTGSAISFGAQHTGDTYTVQATNATTGCQQTMTGSVTVTANPAPTPYAVTGGGAYCAGSLAPAVGLAGSQTGVNYQLLRGSTPVGSPLAGTGQALSFGTQATAGTYTVLATNTTTTCSQTMTGSATVTVNPTPVLTVTTPPAVCAPTTVDLTRYVTSDIPAAIRFYTDQARTQVVTTPIAVAASGTFYVQATSEAGCVSTTSVVVTVNTPPTVSIVPSALTGCAGTIITLSAQGADRYVWNTGATTTSIPVTATGTGVYSVTGTVTSTGCSATASQSITIYPLPAAPSVLTQTGQSYPGGQSSVTVDVNSGNVNLVVGGCSGTINWKGPARTSGTTSPIVVPTDRVGQFIYTATCTSAQGCTSPATSATVTVQGRLTVLHRDVDNYADNNAIQPLLQLQNQGSTALPLSALTLRYYLTVEGNNALSNLNVNYAQVGNQNVRLRYVPLTPAQSGAGGYVEVSFTAGAGNLAAGANSGPIQAYFAKGDYGSLFEPDDYSYNPVRDQLTATQRITAYYNGVLIAGIEPGSGAQVRSVRALTESRNGPDATQINTVLEVRNEGTVAINYSDLKARYYFTADGNERLQVEVDEGNITTQLVKLAAPVNGADYYLEIRYNQGGQLAPGASTGAIRYRISKPDGGRFNQANDYSYQEQPQDRAQNSRVVVLAGNQIVWGTPPAGAPARLAYEEAGSALSVKVLGNPIQNNLVSFEVTGAEGQPLQLQLLTPQGRLVSQQIVPNAEATGRYHLSVAGQAGGLFLLQVSTPTQSQTVKVIKAN